MKKVVVMPYADYENMNVSPPIITQQSRPTSLYDPKIEKMNVIEKELGEILHSPMNIHEKRTKYQDILQTLLDLKDKFTQDNPHAFRNEDPTQEEEYLKDFKSVLETVLPLTGKNKGIALYETLKDELAWDTKGQIVIDGQPVIGSNIVDLISDLVKNWKRGPITGWPIIKQKLRTINFPRSLILNQNRLSDLEKVFSTPMSLSSPSPTPSSRSKRTHKSPYPEAKKLRKKAIITREWLRA